MGNGNSWPGDLRRDKIGSFVAGGGGSVASSAPAVVVKRVVPDAELRAAARASLAGFDPSDFNIVVAGHSGGGKSSFVNCERGLQDEGGPEVAAVGIVDETEVTTKYDLPGHPRVKIWDVAGFGTELNPGEGYFMTKNLHAFDAIVLVSQRVGESDAAIALGAARFGLPLLFVHSKMDQVLDDLTERSDDKEPSRLWAIAAAELLAVVDKQIRPKCGSVETFLLSVRMSRRGTLPQGVEDGVSLIRARLVALAAAASP